MVSGERALQGAALFFIENRCRVIQHSRALSDLTESMGEWAELRAMVRRQGETISLLTDHMMRLERWRRNLRRGSGDSSGGSSGSSIYGSAWSGLGTRVDPVVECQVQLNFLEPVSSEEEREVHVVENVRPVPVRAPTPGPSRLSLAEHLGVNYDLWMSRTYSERSQSVPEAVAKVRVWLVG